MSIFRTVSAIFSAVTPISSSCWALFPIRTYINTNRIITGNVTGDKHFRGTVPYGSVSEFQDDLGSDDLNSFIRRSSGVSYRGGTSEYYLPSRTVTSIRRGPSSGLSRPQITFAGGTGKYKPVDLSAPNPAGTYYQKRPSLPDLKELERRIHKQPEFDKLRKADAEAELAMAEDDFDRPKKTSELDDILTSRPQKPDEPANVEDTYERLKKARQERKDEAFRKDLMEEIAPVEIEPQDDETEIPLDKDSSREPSDQTEAAEPGSLDEYNKATDTHARALEIRGEHATFAEYADAKFKKYIRTAQEFIKEGKYYLAADAYSLAEVYDLGNIEATVGMAHCLFAAGEYMSSAFLIRKTLRMQPEYAKETTPLGDLLIDRDMIEDVLILVRLQS